MLSAGPPRWGHSGQVSPIESSTSRTAASAAPAETPIEGSRRAISKARSRACGSARSCIQPCSSHSRMAPASWGTWIARPHSVRSARRLLQDGLHHVPLGLCACSLSRTALSCWGETAPDLQPQVTEFALVVPGTKRSAFNFRNLYLDAESVGPLAVGKSLGRMRCGFHFRDNYRRHRSGFLRTTFHSQSGCLKSAQGPPHIQRESRPLSGTCCAIVGIETQCQKPDMCALRSAC
ncbi:hypothetical protein ACVILK_003479 [Bradyrhizobium embrapense]